ncbi:hypothetical protein H920_09765 [Fukomys damarensis]|uniref:Uncharacterized protein n=1 Tax=Fukomys damarensis TaxID=885580 RepID=A0A091DEB7_FUKDA|nr:hypothetical protein H920_09765 [Fukomys damarensis]
METEILLGTVKNVHYPGLKVVRWERNTTTSHSRPHSAGSRVLRLFFVQGGIAPTTLADSKATGMAGKRTRVCTR